MFSFGLENLRRLKDVERIEIRPITLLVGRNSSGKSSYLRALPLLRQSSMTRTSSPILWYGDFVDFGSYEGAISDNDVSKKMSFRFSVDRLYKERRHYYSGAGFMTYPGEVSNEVVDCDVSLKASKDSAQICAIKIVAHISEKKYEINVENTNVVSSMKMDDEDILKYFQGIKFYIQQGSIFPSLYATSERALANSSLSGGVEVMAAAEYFAKIIKPFLDKRLKEEAVVELCANLLIRDKVGRDDLALYAQRISIKSFSKLLVDISGKDTKKLFAILEKLHAAIQVMLLVRAVGERLRKVISGVLYIGPARARSERYYRYQDLAVSEIDPDGKNFPMFLNSLKDAQFRSLSSWVEQLFSYKLELSRSSGHISINVVEKGSTTNVVDTGYGVSQILPVLGQIWWAMNAPRDVRSRNQSGDEKFIVIEQPELHLHPAHQALLADALAEGNQRSKVSKAPRKLSFIIETHSETLVNRLGQLISEKKIDADDVQVVLFEPDDGQDRLTKIRISRFGSEGQLIDWPYGFFQPSV